MKQYLTIEEYRDLGGKIPADIPTQQLDRWLQLATVKVDEVTMHRVFDLAKLTSHQKEYLQLATMYQTDYLYAEDTQGSGIESPGVASWSVTDVSVSYNTNDKESQYNRERHLSSLAISLLDETGLTWRGC